MKGRILGGPPGFATYEGFFSELKEACEPVSVDAGGKRELCKRLKAVCGEPKYLFDEAREDLLKTAEVKDVCSHAQGRLYVRYEVSALKENCEGDGPYQLLTLWSKGGGALLSYTFVHGTGRHGSVAAMLYRRGGSQGYRRVVRSRDDVLQFVGKMADGDAVVIGNDDCDGEFLLVDSRHGNMMLSWQVFAKPWIFNSTKHVPIHVVRNAVDRFFEKGVLGVQELCEWEPAEDYDETSRLTEFVITRSLRRLLFRALRLDNVEEVKALHAHGVVADGSVAPQVLKVPFGIYESMFGALHELAYAEPKVLSEVDEKRLRLFLALQGDELAQCDLANKWQEGEEPFTIECSTIQSRFQASAY